MSANLWGCRLGFAEAYDGDARYCHEHGGFTRPHARGVPYDRCDNAPTPSVCDPNALTGTCRWDHDHSEEDAR